MINWPIEETLDLSSVEIYGHDPVGAGRAEQVRDKTRGDGLTTSVLLVLPRIGIKRCDNGDPLGRCALQRIDHDQLLHRPLVHWCGMALDHEGVAAANRLVEPDIDL